VMVEAVVVSCLAFTLLSIDVSLKLALECSGAKRFRDARILVTFTICLAGHHPPKSTFIT
jgi:hypothetical protein